MGQGYNSYLMISEEGTQLGTEAYCWGVDSGLFQTGLYFDNETLAPVQEQKFLTEIGRSGVQDRAVKRYRQHGIKCEGAIEVMAYPEGGGDKGGIGMFLKHAFGGVTSGTYSGIGTYLHTFTPKDNLFGNMSTGTGISMGTGHVFGLTIHIGKEDDYGTIQDYPFLGCRIKTIDFSCKSGEEMKCKLDVVGRRGDGHGASKSVSYPTMSPFLWKDATFQIGVDESGAGGVVHTTLEDWSIKIDNSLKEIWTLGTNVLGRVIPNAQRKVTGVYTVPFEQWVRSEYDKWTAGTPSSMNMSFVSGSYRLEFRCPKFYYTGKCPNISKMDEVTVSMDFQAVVSSTFDVRIFLVNTDRTIGFGLS